LKARSEELPERIAAVLTRLKDAEKELDAFRAGAVLEAAAGLVAQAVEIDGVAYLGTRCPDETKADDLRRLALDIRARLGDARPSVVAAVAAAGGRPALVIATNSAARARGLKAGALVKVAAGVLGGGGGGKDDVAQGGGQDPARIEEALAALAKAVAGTAGG
ncbi:MAG: DHHA1 domain-containing protein, partial [Sporichthyaceae bacterium]